MHSSVCSSIRVCLAHLLELLVATWENRGTRIQPDYMLWPPVRWLPVAQKVFGHGQTVGLHRIRQERLLQSSLEPPRMVGVEVIAVCSEHRAYGFVAEGLLGLRVPSRGWTCENDCADTWLLIVLVLGRHGTLGDAPSLGCCKKGFGSTLLTIVLAREPIWISIDLSEELMQGLFAWMAPANF